MTVYFWKVKRVMMNVFYICNDVNSKTHTISKKDYPKAYEYLDKMYNHLLDENILTDNNIIRMKKYIKQDLLDKENK